MIPLPKKHKDIESFCMHTIKDASGLPDRVIEELRRHKWWIMRDFSRGKNTPECYALFIEIGLDSPPIMPKSTAIVCWSPKPYEWSLWERIVRKVRRKDYPRKGDILSVISAGTSWFEVRQEYPHLYPATVLRTLWNSMTNQGWTPIAQGEIAAPVYAPMEGS